MTVGVFFAVLFLKKFFEKSNRVLAIFFIMCYNGKNTTTRGIFMAVSYDKLWKKLIDKKMTKNALRVQAEMSSSTMAKMSKNETVSMDVILRICKVLNCNIEEILEIVNED